MAALKFTGVVFLLLLAVITKAQEEYCQTIQSKLDDLTSAVESLDCQATWEKVNDDPVCFCATGDKYGTFSMSSSGDLAAIRLVNRHGYVTCDHRRKNYWSYWGCGSYNSNEINVVITDNANNVVFPQAELILNDSKVAIIPGYNSASPELVMSLFNPKSVQLGEQFRLWYGEDLMGHGESDNGGRACIDVYALYI